MLEFPLLPFVRFHFWPFKRRPSLFFADTSQALSTAYGSNGHRISDRELSGAARDDLWFYQFVSSTPFRRGGHHLSTSHDSRQALFSCQEALYLNNISSCEPLLPEMCVMLLLKEAPALLELCLPEMPDHVSAAAASLIKKKSTLACLFGIQRFQLRLCPTVHILRPEPQFFCAHTTRQSKEIPTHHRAQDHPGCLWPPLQDYCMTHTHQHRLPASDSLFGDSHKVVAGIQEADPKTHDPNTPLPGWTKSTVHYDLWEGDLSRTIMAYRPFNPTTQRTRRT